MLSDSNFRKTTKCSFYKNFLANRNVPSFPIQRVSQEFLNTTELVHATGFNKPFVVTAADEATASGEKGAQNEDKLGIVLPSRDKDLVYVSEIVGPSHPVKIIEVGQQSEISDWTLGEYAQYLTNYRADHHKVLNMITLEFSATPFNAKVQAPTFVRDLDWIDTIWPIERRARGDYPKVQKYCLAGMAGSYTDFHIDFGGTSVWYHVLKGQKRFYLVPPTTSNLKAFEKWTCSSAQSDVFFGDLLESPNQCFQFDLNPGETFMIPSGWIHAVYTPVDSLVFGGNFVHSYAILRQLQIYSIEHRTRVQKAYRFPFFRQINWYFLVNLLPLARSKYLAATEAEAKPQVASWIEDLMRDDSDEEEAEVDDLQAACDNLKDPIVLYQLPYLVKTCEIWHKSGGGQEKSVFEVSLEDTGCGNVEEVLAEWWKVLFAIAERHSADEAARDATTAHVRHIQGQAALDLLDDALVRPVFGSFEKNLMELLPAPTKKIVEEPVSAGIEETPSEPLKLKFTFKRAAPASVPALSVHTLTEPAPAEVTATRRSTVKQESMSTANFLEELKKMQEAPAPVAQPKITITHDTSPPVIENPAPKKPIALKLTLGSKSVPTKPVVTAPKEVKVANTVSARATRPLSERSVSASSTTSSSTEAAGRSSGGRRYGTRGLKLSKDFLNRAMDVDIGDFQEGSEDEAQREDAEEEEYGESQGRFGQSHRSDRDDGDRKSSRGGDDFAFRERDEEEGGEWGSKGVESSRAAPTGTFLDSDEENSDDEMDSDAEEDFSDEDGFIVNDTARRGGQKRKASHAEVHKAPPKRVAHAPVVPAKPQYFVDRLSESHERNVRANAAVLQQHHVHMSTTSVPQIQGVRINTGKKPAAPVNNRAKIMKKLGFK